MNLLNSFGFELPTRIEYGPGIVRKLPQIAARLNLQRIVLVADPGVTAAGLLKPVCEHLEKAGIAYTCFSDIEANPKDFNVAAGTVAARDFKADGLLAVGGGSPIDCAKAMAITVTHEGAPRHFEGGRNISNDVLPLIAIPTTAGTGSEVTFSAVITDSRENYKFSIRHTRIGPAVALVDPELTLSMPPDLTAATGMDALTHAIEAYTATVAEPLADAVALYATELIGRYLRRAFADGQDLEARAGMLMGSLLAGIAFSHADVAAVHCIAEALGGRYDTPHGVCNAVVLPAMMRYNLDWCRERYARIGLALGLPATDTAQGAENTVAAVEQLARDIGLPSFNSFGVDPADFELLAANSVKNGSNPSNPRPMAAADYLNVLKTLQAGV
jgi:alcohol dehydrogenase